MGKLDKEQEARMAGMAYALGIAEKKGIDGLRKELQMRGAYDHKSMCLVSLDQYAEHFVTFEDMAIDLKKRYNIDMNAEMIASNQEVIDKGRRVLPNVIKLLERENQHEAADVLREHLHEAVAVW